MTEPETVPQFEGRNVTVRWPEDVDAARMANVFAIQATPDGVVMTLGQANPPIPFGTSLEEQKRQALSISEVTANVLCRVILSPERLRELADALAQVLGQLAQMNPQLVPQSRDKAQT